MSYPQQPNQPHPWQQPHPPQGWGPPPAPPKKRRTWLWVLLGVVTLLVIVGVASGEGTAPTPGAPSTTGGSGGSSSGATTVRYEILGSGKASNITYGSDGTGSIAQEANVKLPWSKDIQLGDGFAVPTVSAQNAGRGDITCRISVNGEVVKEVTSSGQYSVVTCAGEAIF